jgi:hypothetical protein
VRIGPEGEDEVRDRNGPEISQEHDRHRWETQIDRVVRERVQKRDIEEEGARSEKEKAKKFARFP